MSLRSSCRRTACRRLGARYRAQRARPDAVRRESRRRGGSGGVLIWILANVQIGNTAILSHITAF